MPAPSTSPRRSRFRISIVLMLPLPLLLILVFSGGAKKKYGRTYVVKGAVLINGEPAKGAMVTFVPVHREQNPDLVPLGIVREDGSFAMGTYEAGDGVPPGEYQVGIVWRGRPAGNTIAAKKTAHADKLQGKFKPSTSGIRVMIEAKNNQLEPFSLKAATERPKK